MPTTTSRLLSGGLLLAAVLTAAAPALATPTDITVRVLSRGAKFVGSSMGGVQVLLRDVETGELLAQGVTAGGTGETERIMKAAHRRGATLSTAEDASYHVTLELERPRLIEVTARGPIAQRQALNSVSATQWVVPGKHLTGGDGWLLELPGFVVDVLAPPAHVKLGGLPQTVELRANVTMMCGCPIEPGGLWDASAYEVRALFTRNDQPAGEVALGYAGATSQFAATLKIEEPGVYAATVYAYDPANGNTGIDRVTFVVGK